MDDSYRNILIFLLSVAFLINLLPALSWISNYPDHIELNLQPGEESWLTTEHSWQTKIDYLKIENLSENSVSNITAIVSTAPFDSQPLPSLKRQLQANLCAGGLHLNFNSSYEVQVNWTSQSEHLLLFKLGTRRGYASQETINTYSPTGNVLLETGPETVTNSRMISFDVDAFIYANITFSYSLDISSAHFNEACDLNTNGTGMVKIWVDLEFRQRKGYFEGKSKIFSPPDTIPILQYDQGVHIVLRNNGPEPATINVFGYLTAFTIGLSIIKCLIVAPLMVSFGFAVFICIFGLIWCCVACFWRRYSKGRAQYHHYQPISK